MSEACLQKEPCLLEVQGLKMLFPTGGSILGKNRRYVHAVDGVSFSLRAGETLGIVGESGCGKSTVGNLIVRLLKETEGRILFDGHDITAMNARQFKPLRKEMQMVFQDPFSSLNPRKKVFDIIAEPYHIQTKMSPAEIRKNVEYMMELVGLDKSYQNRYPHEFSGGQRQRIGIARALIVEPEFIIADEPISALDMSIRAQVLNLLRHLQQQRGITYLFIAHDLSVMRYISDRIAVIHKGDIVELADAEELTSHPIHPYTRSLLSAIPMPSPRRERGKKLLVYDPAIHHYDADPPAWRELRPRHWVLCNEGEAAAWLRDAAGTTG